MTLEEIILRMRSLADRLARSRAAPGRRHDDPDSARRPPHRGDGVAAAEAVAGIEEVAITAHVGQDVVPLPEGWQYLGFIFARADSPAAVEGSLRDAHARLAFTIA